MPQPDPPLALIEHELPGRLRLRVPLRRGDRAFFQRVEARLGEAGFVRAVRGNAATGSLLLWHDGALGDLVAYARANGLFDLRPDVPRSPRPLPRRTGMAAEPPRPSLRMLTAAGLAGLGVAQIARGRIVGPATESFWNAHRARTALGRPWLAATLAALGMYRAATGPALGSAVSLLFYAVSAWEQRRTDRSVQPKVARRNGAGRSRSA